MQFVTRGEAPPLPRYLTSPQENCLKKALLLCGTTRFKWCTEAASLSRVPTLRRNRDVFRNGLWLHLLFNYATPTLCKLPSLSKISGWNTAMIESGRERGERRLNSNILSCKYQYHAKQLQNFPIAKPVIVQKHNRSCFICMCMVEYAPCDYYNLQNSIAVTAHNGIVYYNVWTDWHNF